MDPNSSMDFRQGVREYQNPSGDSRMLRGRPIHPTLRELSMKNPIIHACLSAYRITDIMSFEEAMVAALEALANENERLHKDLVREKMMSTRPLLINDTGLNDTRGEPHEHLCMLRRTDPR